MRIAIVFDRSAFLLIKTNLLRDSSARAFITTSFLHPYALEYVQNTLFRDVVWITLYPNYNTVYGLFTWPLNSYLLSYYSSMGIPVNKVWVVMCLLSTWPLYISRKDSRNFHYNSNRQVLLCEEYKDRNISLLITAAWIRLRPTLVQQHQTK